MNSSNIKYVLGVDGLVDYQLLGFIIKAKLTKEKTNFRQPKKLACLGDSHFRSNNKRAWKFSLLTLQQEKAEKQGLFLDSPEKWGLRAKLTMNLERQVAADTQGQDQLPEQKLPEPEPGRNRIIMLINGWGCVLTNRRVGLPGGCYLESRADICVLTPTTTPGGEVPRKSFYVSADRQGK